MPGGKRQGAWPFNTPVGDAGFSPTRGPAFPPKERREREVMNMPEQQKENSSLILQVLSYVGEQINFLRQEMNTRYDRLDEKLDKLDEKVNRRIDSLHTILYLLLVTTIGNLVTGVMAFLK